jgi:hypothetical protein
MGFPGSSSRQFAKFDAGFFWHRISRMKHEGARMGANEHELCFPFRANSRNSMRGFLGIELREGNELEWLATKPLVLVYSRRCRRLVSQ